MFLKENNLIKRRNNLRLVIFSGLQKVHCVPLLLTGFWSMFLMSLRLINFLNQLKIWFKDWFGLKNLNVFCFSQHNAQCICILTIWISYWWNDDIFCFLRSSLLLFTEISFSTICLRLSTIPIWSPHPTWSTFSATIFGEKIWLAAKATNPTVPWPPLHSGWKNKFPKKVFRFIWPTFWFTEPTAILHSKFIENFSASKNHFWRQSFLQFIPFM